MGAVTSRDITGTNTTGSHFNPHSQSPSNRRRQSLIQSPSILMVSREDAIKQLEILAKNESLPESLIKNKIGAEPLLFREA